MIPSRGKRDGYGGCWGGDAFAGGLFFVDLAAGLRVCTGSSAAERSLGGVLRLEERDIEIVRDSGEGP